MSSNGNLTPTPRETSPYRLLQEELRDDPWRLLVAVICMNRAKGLKVREVLKIGALHWGFFSRYPDAVSFIFGDARQITEWLKPLGFQNVRYDRLRKMSLWFIENWSPEIKFITAKTIPGIGQYGADSYNVFVGGYLVHDVQDKELLNHYRWALSITGDELGGASGRIPEGKEAARAPAHGGPPTGPAGGPGRDQES